MGATGLRPEPSRLSLKQEATGPLSWELIQAELSGTGATVDETRAVVPVVDGISRELRTVRESSACRMSRRLRLGSVAYLS